MILISNIKETISVERKMLATLLLFLLSQNVLQVDCDHLYDMTTKSIKSVDATFKDIKAIGRSYEDNASSRATYEDIVKLNATCNGLASCQEPRMHDTLEYYNCDCGEYCSLFGTCCVDSMHINKYPNPLKNVKCEIFKHGEISHELSIINTCDSTLDVDSTTEALCNSNGRDLNDPFLEVPVTDPVTGITYKNYYCFACNENYGSDNPIPWNVILESNSEMDTNLSLSRLHFDATILKWVIQDEKGTTEVSLRTSMSDELLNTVHYCRSEKFADCASNWTDDAIKKKCLSYMALVKANVPEDFLPGIKIYVLFRNPHCVICNYKELDEFACDVKQIYSTTYVHPTSLFVGLFSMADKKEKCADNMAYDYFAKKCRKVFKAKRKLA